MKSKLKQLSGLLLGLLLIVWVLRQADPQRIWEQLVEASWGGLALAALLTLGQCAPRVWRWRALLEPVRVGIAFRPMFSAVILGYMTSWLIPGRLGEVVRPALLSGRERIPLGACLGSVVVDRMLDGMSLLGLFALGVAMAPLEGAAAGHAALLRTASIVVVGLMATVVLALLGALALEARLTAWLHGRSGALAWVMRSLLAVARGAEAIKRPRLLLRVVLHSVLVWIVIAIGTWLGLRACTVDISPWSVLILMPLLALGISVPTPGGAGGYHAAMAFGLRELFGVDASIAVGAGVLLHAVSVVPVILLGLILLRLDRLPFHDLLDAGRQIRDMGAAPMEDPT